MIPQPGAEGLYAGYPKSVLFDFSRNATTLTSEAIDLAEALGHRLGAATRETTIPDR
jgi:hypothetical protein